MLSLKLSQTTSKTIHAYIWYIFRQNFFPVSSVRFWRKNHFSSCQPVRKIQKIYQMCHRPRELLVVVLRGTTMFRMDSILFHINVINKHYSVMNVRGNDQYTQKLSYSSKFILISSILYFMSLFLFGSRHKGELAVRIKLNSGKSVY